MNFNTFAKSKAQAAPLVVICVQAAAITTLFAAFGEDGFFGHRLAIPLRRIVLAGGAFYLHTLEQGRQ